VAPRKRQASRSFPLQFSAAILRCRHVFACLRHEFADTRGVDQLKYLKPAHRYDARGYAIRYLMLAVLAAVAGGFQLANAAELASGSETGSYAASAQHVALRERLASVEKMIQGLKTSSQENVQSAVSEQKKCLEQVKSFDTKLGDIDLQRNDFDRRGDELRVSLARSAEQQKNSAAEIEKLRKDVERTRASLDQLERNFELLRKWWWVPGYGQYLAVKTLVDGEITQHRSLLEELNFKNMLVANQAALVLGARKMMCEIAEERESIDGAAEALTCVQGIVQKKGEEFRVKTIALTNREEFWQRMNDMGSITVDGRRRVLADLLNAAPSNQMDKLVAAQVERLEGALSDYSRQLDQGKQFLAATPADYCMHEDAGNQCGVPRPKATSSFQFSCNDIKVGNEADVLTAQCRKYDGSMQSTSIRLRGIHNMNGVLAQNAAGASSFQRSCTNVFICGTSLMASCRTKTGSYVDSMVKISGLHNANGALVY